MYLKCSKCAVLTVLLLGLGQVYCLNKDNKKDKTIDLIAEASFYQPSYHYSQSPVEQSSAYKKYNDDRDSYGKYDKGYGDTGYNHYGKFSCSLKFKL